MTCLNNLRAKYWYWPAVQTAKLRHSAALGVVCDYPDARSKERISIFPQLNMQKKRERASQHGAVLYPNQKLLEGKLVVYHRCPGAEDKGKSCSRRRQIQKPQRH